MNAEIINDIRKNSPLIHHLTNQVVMNFTANGLLSFGGSPIMAKAEEEASEMASIADGVLINIGTLTANELSAMILAGKAANQKGIPVVLDPVGVAATSLRSSAVKQILEEVRVAAIKGNAGEMAHLVQVPWRSKGVESIGAGNTEEIARKIAKSYQTTAVVTGKTDIICTGNTTIHNETGHPFLTKVTGAGCLLGSILTACLTTDAPIEEQALTAVEFYGLAAKYAANRNDVTGSGSFSTRFIDALSLEVIELERR
ncbi:hydroxyethylthiazole kinase [Virgibacillus profundi]|uniref:Hydroxyethylthiazole kinase n=1 Tax=Virgibacillus profundi TaxID=2024555 RepID=A0A2A2IEP6_9BACI|nr:hydroxyethylthiazole kinase [Virgibacillus profundi]PAV30491.1 hydroxyethylthiazole kinase [Virgibacillus profundi]PXY54663.1 hydroxyethylthiazole kinase [Virgibacillus profundi]